MPNDERGHLPPVVAQHIEKILREAKNRSHSDDPSLFKRAEPAPLEPHLTTRYHHPAPSSQLRQKTRRGRRIKAG